MRKLLIVALGVVSFGLIPSGAAVADEIIVIRPDVETCDTVYVWNASSESYTALGRPCNYQPPLVAPEESAS